MPPECLFSPFLAPWLSPKLTSPGFSGTTDPDDIIFCLCDWPVSHRRMWPLKPGNWPFGLGRESLLALFQPVSELTSSSWCISSVGAPPISHVYPAHSYRSPVFLAPNLSLVSIQVSAHVPSGSLSK